MGDPDTFWLNVTNIAMGAAVLLCALTVAAGALYGWIKSHRESRTS